MYNLAAFLFVVLIFMPVNKRENPAKSRTDYCNLYGAVYVVDKQQLGNYKVFIEDSEAFADMLVYKTDNSLYADKPGIWYFVNNRSFADFTVYFVDSKEKADFSIYYTDYESMAGCSQ